MIHLRKTLSVTILTTLLLVVPTVIHAGWTHSYSDDIRSLKIEVNDNWMSTPVIEIGSEDLITLSFDEMSHQYHQFTYHITHCNADWQPSKLHEQDYLIGFNDMSIDQYKNSLNTTFQYTHYRITFPNDDVALKLSGNYKIEIKEDDKTVAEARFAILDPRVSIGLSVSSNTDIDTNNKHQQLELTISYPGLQVIDPLDELKEVVIQNGRIDEAITDIKPSYIRVGQIRFNNNRNLIFKAGNEFRRFEIINMYDYMQHVEQINYFYPHFHATLYGDTKRINYSYDKDHNGRYLVRHSDSDNGDTEADYLFVHFSYSSPRLYGGNLYISGDFTDRALDDRWKMEYDTQTESYEFTALLKEGAYDYQYLWIPSGKNRGETEMTEGDFYETENEYLVFVYYRPTGSRHDQLVGMAGTTANGQ